MDLKTKKTTPGVLKTKEISTALLQNRLLKQGVIQALFNKRLLFACCCILLSCTQVFSQGDPTGSDLNFVLPKILLPSPEASLLNKGASFNVGMFTGTAGLSLPLYKLESHTINLPIGLRYSSNGVKVNQQDSRVGIDWILEAGGVITKTIMDEDDDLAPLSQPPTSLSAEALANYVWPMYQSQADVINSQPDEYSISFAGHSGKFYYDSLKVLHKTGALNALQIERSTVYGTPDWDFKITDENGIIYFFGGDTAREKTRNINYGAGQNLFDIYKPTSWYLRKIISPFGDTVLFKYDLLNTSTTLDISQSVDVGKYGCAEIAPGGLTYTPGLFATSVKTVTLVQGVILSSISANNGTAINFYYSQKPQNADQKYDSLVIKNTRGDLIKKYSFNYYVADAVSGFSNDYYNPSLNPFINKRLFLKEIVDDNGGQPIKHTMEYDAPDSLPPVFSYAQDHLGYFNGAANTSMIPLLPLMPNGFSICPDAEQAITREWLTGIGANREPDFSFAKKGTLKSVQYPTGGFTRIDWEPNTVYKSVDIYPPDSAITLSSTGSGIKAAVTANSDVFEVKFRQFIQVGTIAYLEPEATPLSENIVKVKITNTTTNTVVYSKDLTPDTSIEDDVELDAASYQLSVTAYGSILNGQSVFTFKPGVITTIDTTVRMPGLRVRKISNDDDAGGKTEKFYYYAKGLDRLNISSGIPLEVNYKRKRRGYNSCRIQFDEGGILPPAYAPFAYDVDQLVSSNMINNYLAGQPNLLYSAVLESDDSLFANGVTAHYYKTGFDIPGHTLQGDFMIGLPFTNGGYMAGNEDSVKIFRKASSGLVLQKDTRNYYSADPATLVDVPLLVCNMKYGPSIGPMDILTSPSSSILEQFDIGQYNRITHWVKLDSTRETLYDQYGNALTTTRKTEYKNAGNLLPTRITTLNSKNEEMAVHISYPADLSGSIYADMVAKNIVTTPIQENHRKGTDSSFTKKTDMGLVMNGYQPQSYQLWRMPYPADTIINFLSYDERGNIREQQKPHDVKEVFIWGYHGQYPVAKIVNSDYATVSALINQSVLDNRDGSYSDAQLRTELNKIRTGLAGTKAMVTTYTYAPLIGITSETDPRGVTTYYEYDSANRLKLIRDKDNNIIKTFQYNYKN